MDINKLREIDKEMRNENLWAAANTYCFERIADALEGYVNDRIETDKVLTGVLQSIKGSMETIDIREELKWTFDEPAAAELSRRIEALKEWIEALKRVYKNHKDRLDALDLFNHNHNERIKALEDHVH